MNRRMLAIAALATAAALMAGCASGVKHKDMQASMAPLKSGEGRVYFFRSSSPFGAAIQPEIRLNNEVVGKSIPGGFFYVDRPAGNYVAAASTETEKTASFALAAGETKYLRSSPSFGVLVGRVVIELESPDKAAAEVADLSFTGAPAAK